MSGAGIFIAIPSLALSIAALVIAIIALANSNNAANGGGGGQGNGDPPALLSIYDDQAMKLLAPNTWTNTVFNTHLFTSDAWSHQLGSDQVHCDQSGIYTFYFAIQAQINTSNFLGLGPPECKPCDLRYSLRATQQFNGTGALFEVPGSLTYSSGQNFFLAKEFFAAASQGDVFRFQFVSLCAHLVLYPLDRILPGSNETLQDSFPSSAVLLIS